MRNFVRRKILDVGKPVPTSPLASINVTSTFANGLPDHPFSTFTVTDAPVSCEHIKIVLVIITVK